jgi:hypothetical protein
MATRVIDGAFDDWSVSDRIDDGSRPGYQVSATTDGDNFYFTISAAQVIGANTTVWLNTDRNGSTGFQVFGFAGGAEYKVNFAADGTLALYTGGAGETLVLSGLRAAWSADGTRVEFAIPKSAVGNPNASTLTSQRISPRTRTRSR